MKKTSSRKKASARKASEEEPEPFKPPPPPPTKCTPCTELPTFETPSPRYGHACVSFQNSLFMFGGKKGDSMNDVHILDFRKRRWQQITSPHAPSPRHYHSANLVGHRVYVFGGWDSTNMYNDVSVFDLETMTWDHPVISVGDPPRLGASASTRSVSTTPTGSLEPSTRRARTPAARSRVTTPPPARVWHNAVHLGAGPPWPGSLAGFGFAESNLCESGNILVFGSWGVAPSEQIHILDTRALKWIRPRVRGEAPASMHGQSACAWGTDVVVFGGARVSRTNELRMLRTDPNNPSVVTWSRPIASRTPYGPRARTHHAACMIGGHLLVHGGWDDVSHLDDLWSFCFATATWQPHRLEGTPRVPCARAGHAMLPVFPSFSATLPQPPSCLTSLAELALVEEPPPPPPPPSDDASEVPEPIPEPSPRTRRLLDYRADLRAAYDDLQNDLRACPAQVLLYGGEGPSQQCFTTAGTLVDGSGVRGDAFLLSLT
eukprot:gnl/Trimastix_PCT/2618.p1 GENE.gnl/Trimastix_PCT/2618~~gnl/Trimastix_PCT/2618.p1  ORF type:complete len:489 (-),score=89.37 gnl/Trimastix_PCT/2618:81-1547(-)